MWRELLAPAPASRPSKTWPARGSWRRKPSCVSCASPLSFRPRDLGRGSGEGRAKNERLLLQRNSLPRTGRNYIMDDPNRPATWFGTSKSQFGIRYGPQSSRGTILRICLSELDVDSMLLRLLHTCFGCSLRLRASAVKSALQSNDDHQ